mmetsp:Transcript_44058/g.79056  ORF Transcript_44058/g.79056 Transcript_44058/m.79056 type:complete len:211 (-) Transcript_44058:2406-3038(-)
MEKQITTTSTKIASLEEELETKLKMVSTTEKALEETRANLKNIQGQYDQEAGVVQTLQEESKGMTAKLAQMQSQQKQDATSQQKQDSPAAAAVAAATAKQIETLQSQSKTLAAQLKEANDNAAKSARVESMSGTLMQSSTNVQARENEIATLKAELMVVKEQTKDAVAKQSKKNDQLALELERVKKQLSNELAEANVELRSVVSCSNGRN